MRSSTFPVQTLSLQPLSNSMPNDKVRYTQKKKDSQITFQFFFKNSKVHFYAIYLLTEFNFLSS